MDLHQFETVEGIEEKQCIDFIETYYRIIHRTGWNKTSCKEILKQMNIGRTKFQRILNSITVNRMYIKLKLGYVITGSNITSGVDGSRRFWLFGKPVYHIEIETFNK